MKEIITHTGIFNVVDQGSGPLVILVHGFPECAYSWRHQIGPLVDAGYRVLVPDMRGFGGSHAPNPIQDYRVDKLVDDLVSLADYVGEEVFTLVGHDWGAAVCWAAATLIPERLRGVFNLSVPYSSPAPSEPTSIFKQLFADQFFYILYFQQEGKAESELEPQLDRFLRGMYYGTGGLLKPMPVDVSFLDVFDIPEDRPEWLTEVDIATYVNAFIQSGLRGGLNYYRNIDDNWRLLKQYPADIKVPTYFMAGELDPVLTFGSQLKWMSKHLVDHRGTQLLPGVGHWIQQEAPTMVNEHLLMFLKQLNEPT